MRVLADLMLKGYEVYGAYRVGNTYDFVIRGARRFHTVEVKVTPDFKCHLSMRKNNPDILALVDHAGKIRYMNKLPKNNP